MVFSQRRGRPKIHREATDKGTPELRRMKALGLTGELLDRLLVQGYITDGQHRAGLRLRWLYTLKYGVPALACVQWENTAREMRQDDPDWRQEREAEYNEAARLLAEAGWLDAVIGLCVHHEMPRRPVCEALELLARHWRI